MAVRLAQLVEHETLNLRVFGSSSRSGGVFTAYYGFQSYVGLLSVPSCARLLLLFFFFLSPVRAHLCLIISV